MSNNFIIGSILVLYLLLIIVSLDGKVQLHNKYFELEKKLNTLELSFGKLCKELYVKPVRKQDKNK